MSLCAIPVKGLEHLAASRAHRHLRECKILTGLRDAFEPSGLIEIALADLRQFVEGCHCEVLAFPEGGRVTAGLGHEQAPVGQGEEGTVCLEICSVGGMNVEQDSARG